MKPSIGRNVHYYLPEEDRPNHANIVDVWPKEGFVASGDEENHYHVNLVVFSHDGHVFSAGVINARYSPTPKPGHWTWPPRV